MKKKASKLPKQKLLIVFILFIFLFSIIKIGSSFASTDPFSLTNVSISNKSETAVVNSISYEKTTIKNDITFHKVGDTVTYKITVVNNGSENYTIKSLTDDNTNEYITYEYSNYEGTSLKPKEEKIFEITVKYANEVTDMTKRDQSLKVTFTFTLEDSNGAEVKQDITVEPTKTDTTGTTSTNPKTGDNIYVYITTAILSVIALVMISRKNRITTASKLNINNRDNKKGKGKHSGNGIKFFSLFLVLAIMLPSISKAATNNALAITFENNIALKDKLIVSYNLNDEHYEIVTKYNETVTGLEEPEIVGYAFDGWKLEDGTDFDIDTTKITDDTTIVPKFIKNGYTISYELNGGTLAEENPSTYTMESDDINLNNPTKTGYTFKGWSGTGLTGDTNTSVTIAQGSSGDRSYTANYTANTYYVKFNNNGGSGSMSNQTMTYDTISNLTANNFTRTGYKFTGWNTEADGNGISYSDKEEVSNLTATNEEIFNLYAQWEAQPTKYAVQIYGINQDVDSSGNTLGLTFGPATGADYNNAYVTHEYEEIAENPGNYNVKIVTHKVAANGSETTSSAYLTNSSGNNVTRTQAQVTARENINLHEMTWAEIASVSDKTVFEDCMLCGDTKSVSLTLNSTITSGRVYNQYGDGAGFLANTINYDYKMWNPSQSQNSYVGTGVTLSSNETDYGSNANNAGGYSSSHIRATLIGKNTKTNQGYAGDVNLSSDTCLYSCIEDDLQAVITPKKVKYVTKTSTSSYTLNDDISDSIWLFSNRELYGTGEHSGNTTEGLGSSGEGYARFSNTESKYYISSYNESANTNRVVYHETGSARSWYIRSTNLDYAGNLYYVYSNGDFSYGYPYDTKGLNFGFCIK